jgi:hypothetical protein
MPHYSDEILAGEEDAALDHVQVSAGGDNVEDGETAITGGRQKNDRPNRPRSLPWRQYINRYKRKYGIA